MMMTLMEMIVTLPTATPAIAPMLLLSGGAVVLSEDDTNAMGK